MVGAATTIVSIPRSALLDPRRPVGPIRERLVRGR
jgi:hypothetical protein